MKNETVHCSSSQPFFPKAFEIIVLKAGLLVLLCFYCLPGKTSGVGVETLKELTAAGTTQDFHLIPYYGPFVFGELATFSGCK
jgi:branched-subunit amino acid transport protein AzlD